MRLPHRFETTPLRFLFYFSYFNFLSTCKIICIILVCTNLLNPKGLCASHKQRVIIVWYWSPEYACLFHVHSYTCLDVFSSCYATVKISSVWIIRKDINKTRNFSFSFSHLTHFQTKRFAPYTSIFFDVTDSKNYFNFLKPHIHLNIFRKKTSI